MRERELDRYFHFHAASTVTHDGSTFQETLSLVARLKERVLKTLS